MLRFHILDLLIDGPSSFAALLGALARHYDYGPSLEVDTALSVLTSMEQAGWVRAGTTTDRGVFHHPSDADRAKAQDAYRAWLPTAAGEDFSLDEVGLWYEIESKGRNEWSRWSNEEEEGERKRWVLDDLTQSRTISIHAESANDAEEILADWLSSNPDIEIIEETKRAEPVSQFETKDGTVISKGVKLTCEYRQES